MKANKLKSLLEDKAEELRSMIESNMQSKGNVEVDCQRLCLINRLNDLSYCINGIEQSDLS